MIYLWMFAREFIEHASSLVQTGAEMSKIITYYNQVYIINVNDVSKEKHLEYQSMS